MILLWGPRSDPPLRAVAAELAARGAPHALLDPDRDGIALARPWAESHEAVLATPTGPLPLEQVDAAYLRPHPVVRLSPRQRELLATVLAWADTTPALVLNRPAAMTPNTSKPLQLSAIARHGWDVPRTLVTTDPAAVAAFRSAVGEVVYKSLSATRSIVRRLSAERAAQLDRVVTCPTQFQEHIPGDELRVHVIGERQHALLIRADVDDYRYPGAGASTVRATPTKLSPALAERVAATVAEMGLLFAGLDLRRAPDGRLHCLEVNPSPGFTYFETLAGVRLAPLVAELLSRRTVSAFVQSRVVS